jgi:hypothetical protein
LLDPGGGDQIVEQMPRDDSLPSEITVSQIKVWISNLLILESGGQKSDARFLGKGAGLSRGV